MHHVSQATKVKFNQILSRAHFRVKPQVSEQPLLYWQTYIRELHAEPQNCFKDEILQFNQDWQSIPLLFWEPTSTFQQATTIIVLLQVLLTREQSCAIQGHMLQDSQPVICNIWLQFNQFPGEDHALTSFTGRVLRMANTRSTSNRAWMMSSIIIRPEAHWQKEKRSLLSACKWLTISL